MSSSEASDRSGLRSLARLIRDAAAHAPWRMLAILAALCIDTAFTVAVPLSFRHLIDHVLAERDGRALAQVLAGLALGAVLAALAGIARDLLWARFSVALLNGLRAALYARVLRLSMGFFARTRTAEITARFTTDLASIEQALATAPAWALVPLLDAVVALGLLGLLDWRLALVASLVLPVSLLGPRLVMGRAERASYDRKQDEARLLGVLQESIQARAAVRAFGLEPFLRRRFDRGLTALKASSVRMALFGALIERSSVVGTLVLQVLVLGAGAWMTYAGHITVGTLAAFMSLFLTVSWSLGYLGQFFPQLLQAAAGARRIDQLLEAAGRTPPAGGVVLSQLAEGIRFEAVSFGYGADEAESGPVVLHDISLQVPAGSSLAIVGPSGAGKSTLLSLLLRFEEPSSGRLLLDGQDMRLLDEASLRARMGVVFQDTVLFDTSIRENIRLGRAGATDAEVEAAARASELHDTILALPRGYDTEVGERGGLLSMGQRQRVAIARAILRDPDILLLDEATSALDPATEAAVTQTLERLGRGRTVIAVTHRLATVARFDRILVLEAGRVAETGRHAELLAADGAYARLWHQRADATIAGA